MKKLFYLYNIVMGSYFIASCNPSAEEQIKRKKMELKTTTDKHFELHEEFMNESKEYSDAIEYYYDLQIAGLSEDDPKCLQAKNEMDMLKKTCDSIQLLMHELQKDKMNVISKQIDSLKKLK
jgi:hypothetical protein